jgi:glycosyltransferase involved in cell wall biosynthesis
MKIVFFFRKTTASFFSIEMLFNTIISQIRKYETEKVFLPSKSASNPAALLKNCLYAFRRQGNVNHITGEVYYIALALGCKKTILTIHDIDSLQSSNSLKNQLLHLVWLKLPILRVKYVTVISNYSKRKLLDATGIAAEKVYVIPNCVQLSDQDFKPQRHIDRQNPVLLQIGTKPNKNLENVIEAIKNITCKLLIIGKLSEAQVQLLNAAQIVYENFFSLDYSEVLQLYYRADIITFVSFYEGFGMPIIEANALGRPVITSITTSMPEVAGDGAILVDPYNPLQIREAIIKLVEDDSYRNDLIAKGLANVRRFKPEVIASMYEDLYQKVMEENK